MEKKEIEKSQFFKKNFVYIYIYICCLHNTYVVYAWMHNLHFIMSSNNFPDNSELCAFKFVSLRLNKTIEEYVWNIHKRKIFTVPFVRMTEWCCQIAFTYSK